MQRTLGRASGAGGVDQHGGVFGADLGEIHRLAFHACLRRNPRGGEIAQEVRTLGIGQHDGAARVANPARQRIVFEELKQRHRDRADFPYRQMRRGTPRRLAEQHAHPVAARHLSAQRAGQTVGHLLQCAESHIAPRRPGEVNDRQGILRLRQTLRRHIALPDRPIVLCHISFDTPGSQNQTARPRPRRCGHCPHVDSRPRPSASAPDALRSTS